jgi:hypothetical protein
MKNRLMMLLALLAVFTISAPALAAPPEGDAAAAGDTKTDDTKADDTKADEKAAEEPKADDAKAGDGEGTEGTEGDAKEDAKDDEKAEIKTDDEAVAAAGELFTAIQEKHWGLALGLGLSLLVFGLRKVKVLEKVPAKMLPWVTAVIGVVGYVAAALMTDGANMTDAIVGGATTGIAAVGLWEMVLKHFLSKKDAGGSAA